MMMMNRKNEGRQGYATPRLQVHGNVEDITAGGKGNGNGPFGINDPGNPHGKGLEKRSDKANGNAFGLAGPLAVS